MKRHCAPEPKSDAGRKNFDLRVDYTLLPLPVRISAFSAYGRSISSVHVGNVGDNEVPVSLRLVGATGFRAEHVTRPASLDKTDRRARRVAYNAASYDLCLCVSAA